jgi:hypothetical protein
MPGIGLRYVPSGGETPFPKLDVEGSNPFARFNLRQHGPEAPEAPSGPSF